PRAPRTGSAAALCRAPRQHRAARPDLASGRAREADDVARDDAVGVLVLEFAPQRGGDLAGVGVNPVPAGGAREHHTVREGHALLRATHWSRCAFSCSRVNASAGTSASSRVAPTAWR